MMLSCRGGGITHTRIPCRTALREFRCATFRTWCWRGFSSLSFLKFFSIKKSIANSDDAFLQRRRDSNPRYLAVRWFSRPVHSTTLPLLFFLRCLVLRIANLDFYFILTKSISYFYSIIFLPHLGHQSALCEYLHLTHSKPTIPPIISAAKPSKQ